MKLSHKLSLIKPSPTVAVTGRVALLRRKGVRVIDLGAGEPDFDTPEHIKEAAISALRKGQTKYTPVGGTLELKEAIIQKLRQEYGLTYSLQEVTAGCGGKHVLFNAFQVLLNEGDEVLIPTPYWVSYSDMVLLAGGTPRLLPTSEETGFKITAVQLEAALGPQSKILVLNSPSNPTGAAYTREELKEIAQVVSSSGLFVISDDVYEKFLYDSLPQAHILTLRPDLQGRVLMVNSVSKTYAMTGWRLGYAAGPSEVTTAMETLQSQSTSNPNSITQAAAIAALTGTQEPVRTMVKEFAKRRSYVVERLRAMPGISCTLPEGAFYVFPRISAYLGCRWQDRTLLAAADLSLYLLEEARVAVVAGEGFGSPEHIRISYATSMENLEQGLDQIEKALRKLESRA